MQPNQPQQNLAQVNIHQLMEKVQSKKDVFNFLSQECEAYLPKMDTVNIFLLKQITRGQKEVSFKHITFLVHQATGSESVSGATDRGPHSRGFSQTCTEETLVAEIFAG